MKNSRIVAVIGLLVVMLIMLAVVAVKFYPQQTAHNLIDLKRSIAGLEKHQLQLNDGTSLTYLASAPSNKPVMLLIHGFGADKDNFNEVAPYLRRDYQLIVPDLAGFGESSKNPKADYTPKAQAQRLHQMMQKLGFSRYHIGGSSMGGYTALHYASMYPQSAITLWLLDSAGVHSAPRSEVQQHIAKTGKNLLSAQSVSEFRDVVDVVMSQPPFAPDFVLAEMAKPRIANFALEQVVFKQVSTSDGVELLLPSIKTPALIVWGQQDRVLHYGAAAILHAGLVNSTVVILPNIGHLPQLEAPRQTAKDLKVFIKQHSAT